jgi:hypothetical protein
MLQVQWQDQVGVCRRFTFEDVTTGRKRCYQQQRLWCREDPKSEMLTESLSSFAASRHDCSVDCEFGCVFESCRLEIFKLRI